MRLIVCLFVLSFVTDVAHCELRVGAVVTDVTPIALPVLVNGSMRSRSVGEVNTPLSARTIVLDDGEQRIALVVVDSCMLPRVLLDDVKQLAARNSPLQADRILISATHTHSAPSSMGCLGTSADENYVPFLRQKLVESIRAAEQNLQAAHVGWAVTNADKFTALRRWIRRPDKVDLDPFGNPTVRANMHSANDPQAVTGPSGPEDPELSLISFQSPDGRPIAVMANFSMHYFSDKALSADYFGLFCNGFQKQVSSHQESSETQPPFVAALSHGCSGDIWRRDYALPPDQRYNPAIEVYASELLELAMAAYRGIEHRPVESIEMAEARLPMRYRVPSAERLLWAQQVVEQMGDRLPETSPEVYAREQILLHEMQQTEVVVQAIRIGEIGIATTPNETYALTGLKLKLQSPLVNQMVIELANGGDGYIPPPEQHHLGGYNTWAARSAGLEIQAEPRITEAALQLLEKISGRQRRTFRQSAGKRTQAILAARPAAFYRLHEMEGPLAYDSSPHSRHAYFDPGMAYFLEGAPAAGICRGEEINRAAHFAGGRLRTRLPSRQREYSVALWFWNGMPLDARDVAGWLISRDHPHQVSSVGEHLGVSGTAVAAGRLIFQQGRKPPVVGQTEIKRWTWNHVLLVRSSESVQVYLNGAATPELVLETDSAAPLPPADLFLGGRCDNQANWEGRLDEVAVFDRALKAGEIQSIASRP